MSVQQFNRREYTPDRRGEEARQRQRQRRRQRQRQRQAGRQLGRQAVSQADRWTEHRCAAMSRHKKDKTTKKEKSEGSEEKPPSQSGAAERFHQEMTARERAQNLVAMSGFPMPFLP
ncbi:unnamed protein product [Durusdinium trenchii]|uniref:Uncharacterized protein n=1 Tax=Durusdinium trenchii TaxID=1381693 RepID=A0ABP0MR95_9DINO